MFIFDVIGDMLSALGWVSIGTVSGVMAIVIVVFYVVVGIIALALAWLLISAVWYWIKCACCWLARKEIPKDPEPLGVNCVRAIKKWLDGIIDSLAEKELQSK